MQETKYRPCLAAEICERLARGETLRSICRDDHMPEAQSVRRWVIYDHNGFASQYANARDIGLDAMSDEILDIADTTEAGTRVEESLKGGTKVITGDMTQHRHLRVETRKWYLSKMAPKRYGLKTTTELTGADGAPLFGEDERARRVAALKERVQKRIAQNNQAEPTDASDLA